MLNEQLPLLQFLFLDLVWGLHLPFVYPTTHLLVLTANCLFEFVRICTYIFPNS